SWKQLTPPLPHRDILGGLIAFDPGGRWLATVSADSLARLWDVQTGKLLRIFSGHTGPLYGVAFSAKGQRLVTGGGDGVARVWSLFDTNELLAHTDQVQDIGFGQGAACGDLLVAVSADATLSLWDIGSGEMIKRIATDGEGLTRVSMSNDCTWIAAAGAAGGLFLTRVDSDSGWQPIESGIGRINAIQLLSDGDDQALRLFVGGAEGVIKAWAISKEDGKATPLWTSTQLRGAVNDLAIFSPSPQGGERHLLAAITNADNTFWEAGIETTGKRVKFEAVKNCGLRRISRSIAVTRGGDLVASLGNQVVVLRVEGDILSCELLEKRISGFLLDLAAGPDGKQFAVTSTSGTVSIGTLSTSDWKRSFAGYRSPVNAVSYAGNGRVLATGSADGKIRLHLLDKQALIRRAEEEQGRVEENLQKK
ncbi:MAG TPA: hypothetical protein ENK50_06060, partial [Sedimenticola sp.]|nr:hypothetical protein [Sedimenticola sp.]